MSTNVIITPAAAVAGTAVVVPLLPYILAGAAIAGVGLFIAATDKRYAALRSKTRERLRDERWATMRLTTRDLDRLVRSARESEFNATSISPEAIRIETNLREPVWLVREPEGTRLIGQEQALRRLSIANTKSRALEHLKGCGYRVKTTTRPSGEIHISAAGQGRRVVDVVVSGHGEATIDTKHFNGRECDRVVRDLAAAIEGTIVKSCPKPEYFNAAPVKVCGGIRA
jgi:hypothetical protein